jgi:hypothetical protein
MPPLLWTKLNEIRVIVVTMMTIDSRPVVVDLLEMPDIKNNIDKPRKKTAARMGYFTAMSILRLEGDKI